MPRPPRIEFEGATFHIVARGNRGDPVFADREDSLKFLSLFEEVCATHDWDAFAWVLMPDHYRLTVRTNQTTLAKGMKHLNGLYAGWVNRRRDITGHLLQGRYQATVVDPEAWLIPLVRLAALDPVRAGLTDKAEQWRWGSWRYLAERPRVDQPQYLARSEVLALVDPDPVAACLRLKEYVDAGSGEEAKEVDALEALPGHNQVLGSRQFAQRVQASCGMHDRLTASEPLPIATYQEEFSPAARSMAAAYWVGGYRQKEIAAAFSTHISTVSRASTKYREEFSG